MSASVRGVYKRGNVYWISWRDLTGKRHRESAGTVFLEAVKARELRMADRHNKKFNIICGLPLRQFIDDYYRPEVLPGLKPSTREGYEGLLKTHLLPELGNTKLSDITRARVREFIASRRGAANTMRNAVALLSSVLTCAVRDHDLLAFNPVDGMLSPKFYPQAHDAEVGRPNFLEPLDFVKAVAAMPAGERDAVLFATLTGLSWEEQTALKAGDISLQTNKIRVRRALWRGKEQTPKSRNRIRVVDMTPTVRRILSRLIQTTTDAESLRAAEYLFPLARHIHYRHWKKASGLRWHDLRHQYAVLCIMAGKHPRWIQAQMGHGDIRLTMNTYGGLMETVAIAHVEWIDDLLPRLEETVNGFHRLKQCDQNVTAIMPEKADSFATVELSQSSRKP